MIAMQKRFVAIWFPYLITDWLTLKKPELADAVFVFAIADHGRKIITAMNQLARHQGITPGMPVADARAIVPSLLVFDEPAMGTVRLLTALGAWCIRFTPSAAIHLPDTLLLDATGCAHLWGGEEAYLTDIYNRLKKNGYASRLAMADTIGAAWAFAHFGSQCDIIKAGDQINALRSLPAGCLRLPVPILSKLEKLGLQQVGSFINIKRAALRRRFGTDLLDRLDQALGWKDEVLEPVQPISIMQERLPCLEPIVTATGIDIAVTRLLNQLCKRLAAEEKGLRTAVLQCYRIDGDRQEVKIGTNHPSQHAEHLYKLFETGLRSIEPALGIELFILEAPVVEPLQTWQLQMWSGEAGLGDTALAELLDRIAQRIGSDHIHRYLPAAHYWPERSFTTASSLAEKSSVEWQTDRARPARLLTTPETIEVTAPVPDYPPMSFRYRNQLHIIKKADGPERIEREWWLDEGPHRDYYQVEDELGQRYWLFRSGHYTGEKIRQWFIHGFFA